MGVVNRYRYNGKEFNEDVGLNDYGARWYDPAIGRWNAVDPSADSYAGWSPYNYVVNNPVNGIDPDGRDYILLFDHENNTLTIRANYYTKSGDEAAADQAEAGAAFWNEQSGKFTYTVGKGKRSTSYTVNFELSTEAVIILI